MYTKIDETFQKFYNTLKSIVDSYKKQEKSWLNAHPPDTRSEGFFAEAAEEMLEIAKKALEELPSMQEDLEEEADRLLITEEKKSDQNT